MSKNLLKEVKKDFEKRGNKNYDLLYSLYALVPNKHRDSIVYHQMEDVGVDNLFIGAVHIGKLEDISDIYSDIKNDNEVEAIKFEKMNTNTGEIYKTKRVVFYINENGYLVYKDEGWIEVQDEMIPVEEGDMPF
ncbi:hypothetical protein NE172_04870 [Clostridium botulinum]|uniref:Uncharacterized protein n=1 Tax=Clostridium botulinum TaxID=1491 RepID=A0A6B4JJ38_CLOBO|nr:hypothetical protein [Clostridium botulinum]EES48756.1 hypothetical protein CLO_1345 [Clostridium botulinum E1 str. 'BoNT E Beluga']MBY6760493.1 hypothetical protein [Clostridium botulinum]MBY6919400.1 hypothetical protein [Clostridium botulinum]MCR1130278.1 hypothetical protein [Clostridium botulinum]NFJ56960.1 hypothetical protein [Clostridium botulinum]